MTGLGGLGPDRFAQRLHAETRGPSAGALAATLRRGAVMIVCVGEEGDMKEGRKEGRKEAWGGDARGG